MDGQTLADNTELGSLRSSGELISVLYEAIKYGNSSIDAVPGMVRKVIQEEAWKSFCVPGSKIVHSFRSFAEFTKDWLKTDIDTLQGICKAKKDQVTSDLIDQAIQGVQGAHINNVNMSDQPKGNTSDYALRKLRKDNPELHTRVLSGEISPNAAMIQAGFRKRKIQVILEPSQAARVIRKHFNQDQVRELGRLLLE